MHTAPPVLLTVGQYYGTLAAVRSLGRAGIAVTLAEKHLLAPARWSRFVRRRVECPAVADSAAFLEWLLEFGAASPGHVLLPTSDEIASLISVHQRALSRHFVLLPTAPGAIETLLDKHALITCCREVGLDVPETWFPRSEAEAIEIGAREGAPLLLKPRTQVLLASHSKGAIVDDLATLPAKFRAFVDGNRYGAAAVARSPDVGWPMLQRLYPSAKTSIYGLSGYCDARGEIVCARASRKILQRPRKLGIGLCFEEAPVDEALVTKLGALCRRVGFRGVFEVEFIDGLDDAKRKLLIDFNPRFYSQLAFDIDRGMDLPLLAYCDAVGVGAGVDSVLAAARGPSSAARVYCHRFILEVMLRAQRLSGRMSLDEATRWRGWLRQHATNVSDAVADREDVVPWGIDVLAHVSEYARHPRAFVRAMVLDQ